MIKYLAGIFDAEGYVRIRKSVATSKGSYSYTAEIKLYMCDKNIVNRFAELYGLTVKSEHRYLNRKVVYYCTMGNNLLKTNSFIKDFLPYLNEKRKQLEEVYNLLFTDKNNEKCYQDYMIAKQQFTHSINGILSYEYIAGIIDGDGWFSMFNAGSAKQSLYNNYSVGLEQRYKPMIDYIASLTKDGVHKTKTKDTVNHVQTFAWYCSTSRILPLLKNIEPFLIEKRNKCNIIINYIEKQEEFRNFTQQELNKWKLL